MQKIGPYEIAGLLATGGMAEILLGRRVGPSGFERVVVIKRILSTLAKDASYVRMFVDEARISARIHHPNVVQVFDLIIEKELLCIVMEFLKGETLASLIRRASTRDIQLDRELCAYVVGEAAAGLHAAHELVDRDNAPVGLVHRDVTPQNIFVTYDGSIKLLDFGIAKAKDRVTQTQTGQLKGSYAYMSPEQCRAEPLDRRSDIFSLGVVLYELTTGHRLFRRTNHLLTLKAVVDGPVVPPSTLVSDYPKRLEEISLRALNRDKSKRYQTASELKRELRALFPDVQAKGLPEVRLGVLMHELFADRIEEKEDLIYNLRQGLEISQCPSPETDLAVTIPTVKDTVPSIIAVTGSSKPRRRAWLAVFGLLIVAIVVGLAIAVPMGDETPSSGGEAPRGPEAAGLKAATPIKGDARAAEPTEVVLSIESTPSKALIWIDETLRGTTPSKLEIARSSNTVELKIFKEGYVPIHMSLVPEAEQHLALKLVADDSLFEGEAMDFGDETFDADVELPDSGVASDGGREDLAARRRRWRRWLRARRAREKRAEEERSKYRRFD